ASSEQVHEAEGGPERASELDPFEAHPLYELRQPAGEVVDRLLVPVEAGDSPREQGGNRVAWPPPVGDVELASGNQDPVDLGERPLLVAADQVVEEEARDRTVERGVLERQVERERLGEG